MSVDVSLVSLLVLMVSQLVPTAPVTVVVMAAALVSVPVPVTIVPTAPATVVVSAAAVLSLTVPLVVAPTAVMVAAPVVVFVAVLTEAHHGHGPAARECLAGCPACGRGRTHGS